MFRMLDNNGMIPRWLKVLIKILLIITVIYWFTILIYKLIDLIRSILHFITEKNNWWMFVICLVVLVVGAILLGEYYFGLEPFAKIEAWFLEIVEQVRNFIRSKI